MSRHPLTLLAALLLAGCSATPEAPDALPDAPAEWSHAVAAAAAPDALWWHAFASAELDALVERGLTDNFDLAAAAARLRQAEASARAAGAPLLPRLDGNLGASREGRLGGDADTAGNLYSGGLAASYEVDLWGRLSADRESAEAELAASRFDRDALRLTLSASLTESWLRQVALAERLRLAELNLANAERVLATVQARQAAGSATQLELAQQRGLVAEQRRSREELRQQADDIRSALAVLLGQAAPAEPSSAALTALVAPSVSAGLPSELLLRRPDLARAEAQLSAADADLRAARAAMLPRLNLSAGASGANGGLNRVFADPLYSLAAALTAPIFDGGALAAERDRSAARREELLAAYRQSIVAAFADVQVALNAGAGVEAQWQAQQEVQAQAERALQLAERRYRAGAEDLLNLLDAQRTLYAAEDQSAQLRLARLQASVALARALGGGWRSEAQ
ncbi:MULTISPECIES: efflux transporter outer membrane subunit [unclassified Pseudomonas]|uniref:efflux transporter outer membrane subunit n=1 Tax=unclassified Pseudomonas TaxID=196821 RepID=UPI00244698A4|nr:MULTISPECIES: efflux transporter outer membrane subunit [unclassified Pseudomonas]MDG9923485.1 efflux transporter outer membrane subunit [Pseudomonas sp. GD04045]MDH0035391.1 efflux transporter outer membrane subunit [Pseudomonas sp. GD04019]